MIERGDVSRALARAHRRTGKATAVGGVASAMTAALLLLLPVNGVVVALGTMLVGGVVGGIALRVILRRGDRAENKEGVDV